MIKKIVAVLIIAFVIVFVYSFLFQSEDRTTVKFNSLLEESHRTILDLRKLDTVEWDEMVFWSPYTDICDYGINGYEKGGAKCQSSVDDRECYLLLLYQNKLVATITIDRQSVDFTKANWEKRVSKEKAVFRFVSKEDWPGVVLAAER